MKKLNEINRSKYFTINTVNISKIITDGINKDDMLNFKDMLTLLYLINKIEYDNDELDVTKMDKKTLQLKYDINDDTFNHVIVKLNSLNILTGKVKNGVYKFNKNVINFGHNNWKDGEYIKVSSQGLFEDIKNSDTKLSSNEIAAFLYLLNDINFYEDGPFMGNTLELTKDKKEEVKGLFNMSQRALELFISKLKKLDFIEKKNNTFYRLNDSYFTFGGDIIAPEVPDEVDLSQPLREARIVKPNGASNTSMSKFFNKGGRK